MDCSGQLQTFDGIEGRQTRRCIGLLGGTFNPVHNGHLYMARKALDEFGLEKVVFIPSGNPPHKANETVAHAEHRYAMLELALEGAPGFFISRVELDRPGPTYTADTLETLHRASPDSRFYFIIGADTLCDLHTWRNFERVAQLAAFICFMRPGVREETVRAYMRALADTYGLKTLLSAYAGLDVSSRQVREALSQRRPVDGLVGEKVARYIRDNGVYG
mgnify:CR=1 FL=1